MVCLTQNVDPLHEMAGTQNLIHMHGEYCRTLCNHCQARLDAAQMRLEAKLNSLDKELNAKVAALEQQVGAAKADAQEKIKQRIAALRSDYKTRTDKLKAAWSLAKEALAA